MLRGIENVTGKRGYQTMLAHYGYQAELEEERVASPFLLQYRWLTLVRKLPHAAHRAND